LAPLVFFVGQKHGKKLLEQVARQRITELRASGEALVNAIDALLGKNGNHAGAQSGEGN
jgi:hypothetical protein